MFERNHIQRDFSRAASHYDDHAHLQRHVMERLLAKMQPLLASSSHILDAGCGTGRFRKHITGHRITQLDIAPMMCAHAASENILTVNAAIEQLPFADATFDGVFSSLVLQWNDTPARAICEMQRVIKPGGVLAISTLGARTLYELRESFTVLDALPHVSDFVMHDEGWEQEEVIEFYPDMRTLFGQLKQIGARNKMTGRKKTLTTRSALQRVEHYYREHFGKPSGLPVTWDVLYKVVRV